MNGDRPGRRLHAQDRLATGNPTYGGGSNAATFGTVDPAGYVDRERRSGLAKAIMGRREAGGGDTPGAPRPELVGETAWHTDRAALIRTLAARLGRQGG